MKRPLLAAAGVLLASLLLVVELALPDFSGTVEKVRVTLDQGCAYKVALPKAPWWPLIEFRADGPSNQEASRLRLYEDGAALGPAHALHGQIRGEGGGAYSHWAGVLWFSTSDCSNPASTDRQYTFTVPRASTPLTQGAAILGVFFVLFAILPDARKRQLRNAAAGLLPPLIEPSGILSTTNRGAWTTVFLIAVSWTYLYVVWARAATVSESSLASIYPVSDAKDYWVCANMLLDKGAFGEPGFVFYDWCQRRPIYSSLLATIVGLSGREIVPSLLAQAALVGVGIAILARRAERAVGFIGVLVAVGLIAPFAARHAIPVTMTEAAGLVFGCVGLAVLLHAAESKSSLAVFSGAALMSVALNARAGAFFVLPALVLWSITGAKANGGSPRQWLVAAIAGCSAGFLLQMGLIQLSGGAIFQAHGNFSYTLYGLAVGGKGWAQVLADHPELLSSGMADAQVSQHVYALAIDRIIHDPATFGVALARNSLLYLGARPFLAPPPLFAYLLGFSWWIGIAAILRHRHEASAQLIGWGSLGAVCSAPLLVQDGGARVFAATVAIDALQIGMGVRLALHFIARITKTGILRANAIRPLGTSGERGLVALLAAAVVFPHLPLARHLALARVSVAPCSDVPVTLVTTIGRESVLLDSTRDKAGIKFWHGEVNPDALRSGLPPYGSIAWDAAKVVPGSLLTGYQRQAGDRAAPGPYYVVTEQGLADYVGKTVRICLSPRHVRRLFDAPYFELQSVMVLPD